MGIRTFETIKNKNQQFFDYFSVITTSDTIDPDGSLIKKPDPQFFALFQKIHNKADKHIIFIDDDQSNVSVAKAAGMQSILFKNPEQLRNELQKIDILSVALEY